ncbi:MAG TPA: hypothetical protein VL993_15080 [Stellaceae bacterium]|nr:hypothetical protein [Stellaceae bacterium]
MSRFIALYALGLLFAGCAGPNPAPQPEAGLSYESAQPPGDTGAVRRVFHDGDITGETGVE